MKRRKPNRGLAIDKGASVPVVGHSESVIIKPDVALAHLSAQGQSTPVAGTVPPGAIGSAEPVAGRRTAADSAETGAVGRLPTRFVGTFMISADRPTRDIHQIVEAIVEQLTTHPGSDVSLKLEIDAEVPSGLDRAKVRTLLGNATTLGFIDKVVK